MEQTTTDEILVIDMGPCRTCGTRWAMTKTEHDRFKGLVRTRRNFRMPINCVDCRRDKEKRDSVAMYDEMMTKLARMTHEAEQGHYSLEDRILATDLREVTRLLKSFLRLIKYEPDQP